MKIKDIYIILIKLLGLFLIYGNMFRYSIGAIANINFSQLKTIRGISAEPRWYVMLFVIFCYAIFIKNAELMASWICKKNAILELGTKDKYIILKIFIITFAIGLLIQESFIFSSSNFPFIMPVFFIGLILLSGNSPIAKYFLSITEGKNIKKFIFFIISLLFYFIFFRNPEIRYFSQSSFKYTFLANFGILIIISLSPFIFDFLNKKSERITLNRFIYILFFWLLILYNLQYLFFNNMFDEYYKFNEEHLIGYIILELVLPLILLFQNKYADKLKTISVVRFTLYVIAYFMISSSIYGFILGRRHSLILLPIGMLLCFIIYKLKFIDKSFQSKKNIVSVEKTEMVSFNFVPIILILALFSKQIFYDRHIFVNGIVGLQDFLKIVLYESVLLFVIIILIRLVSSKEILLNKSYDFIKLLILCICILLFIDHKIFFISYDLPNRDSSLWISLNYTNIFINIFAVILYVSSDYITTIILKLLPKNYEDKLFKTN